MDGIMADFRDEDSELLHVASHLAETYGIPLFYLRKPKKYGLRNHIEGDLEVLKSCKDIFFLTKYNFK